MGTCIKHVETYTVQLEGIERLSFPLFPSFFRITNPERGRIYTKLLKDFQKVRYILYMCKDAFFTIFLEIS